VHAARGEVDRVDDVAALVSLEMQAVAPKESIWLHSAAVGRFASTTMRVSGWRSCSSWTVAGEGNDPKFSSATSGECSSITSVRSDSGTSDATSSRASSAEINCLSPTFTRSSNSAATTVTPAGIG
jgi:hypothetical protein